MGQFIHGKKLQEFFLRYFLFKFQTSKLIMLAICTMVKMNLEVKLKKNHTLNGIHRVLKSCNLDLSNDKANYQNISYLSQHLVKNNQVLSTEKLAPKKLSLSNS